MIKQTAAAALLIALAGPACANPAPDPNAVAQLSDSERQARVASSLAGTNWLLLGYDSFEDGSERDRPARGEVHRIRFEPGGTLVVELACNRGSGRWSADQSEPDRGSLDIGPLKVGRGPCPGANMRRVAEDLEYVGGFVIGCDGHLYLNLRADSGNLVWERGQ